MILSTNYLIIYLNSYTFMHDFHSRRNKHVVLLDAWHRFLTLVYHSVPPVGIRGDKNMLTSMLFCSTLDIVFSLWFTTVWPREDPGWQEYVSAPPCMSLEVTKWDNLFALSFDPCRWRRGSWWLRSSVAESNAFELINTPIWFHIHLDGRSGMSRLDQ